MARNKTHSRADKRRKAGNGGRQATAAGTSGIEMLKQDHRKVESLFEEFQETDDQDRKEELVREICSELIVHMHLEEDVFYPTSRMAANRDEELEELLDEAQVEHDTAKMLVNQLVEAEPDDPYWEAKVSVLCDVIEHHIDEEEKAEEGTFARAQAKGLDDAALAGRLRRLKDELQKRGAGVRPIRPVSMDVAHLQETMEERHVPRSRYGRMPEPGYGRFEAGPRNLPERDEEGHFVNDYSRRPSRYREDEERHDRGGPAERGWYGDPRAHAEAARRGWESRRGGGHYREGDGGSHGHGGWYGDPRGHSHASRRGWQHRR
jgi:hypothetical protein